MPKRYSQYTDNRHLSSQSGGGPFENSSDADGERPSSEKSCHHLPSGFPEEGSVAFHEQSLSTVYLVFYGRLVAAGGTGRGSSSKGREQRDKTERPKVNGINLMLRFAARESHFHRWTQLTGSVESP